jgi:hypothetical protein
MPQWRIPCQKGSRGMWSPHDLGMGGGVDQLMLQASRWGKVWRGGKVQVVCCRAPLMKGARPHGGESTLKLKGACLVGGLVISSFSSCS